MTVTELRAACFALLLLRFGDSLGADPKTPLRIAWWGSPARHELTVKVLQMYESENPGIAIDYDFEGWNDYWTKLTTMAASNNLPDVMQQDYQYLTEWVRRGLVMPLDDLAAGGNLHLSDVAESALAGGRSSGKLYGVSLGVNSTCIMLDSDGFRNARVGLPTDSWTWADFEKVSLALTRKLGIPAVSGNIVHDHIWRSLYLGEGMWAYTADGRALGYPPSEDHVFASHMRMVKRLIAAGANIPYSEIVASRLKGVEDDRIVKGGSVMTFVWSNQVVATWIAAGADSRHFELRPLPRLGPEAASSNYLKPSMFFSITKNSGNPQAAARLIDYFTNSVAANRVLLAERGVPIAGKVRDALAPMLGGPQRAVFQYLERIQKDVTPIPPPDPVGNTDLVNNVFIPQVVDPVMFGVISPEAGMKKLRQEARKILGK